MPSRETRLLLRGMKDVGARQPRKRYKDHVLQDVAFCFFILTGGISTALAQLPTASLDGLVETSARRLEIARQVASAKCDSTTIYILERVTTRGRADSSACNIAAFFAVRITVRKLSWLVRTRKGLRWPPGSCKWIRRSSLRNRQCFRSFAACFHRHKKAQARLDAFQPAVSTDARNSLVTSELYVCEDWLPACKYRT